LRLLIVGWTGLVLACLAGLLLVLITVTGSGPTCGSGPASVADVGAPAAGAARVGATEYGGPADGSSGTVGASGINLLAHPDSYAELGGTTFQTATALGGLAYMTPLRVSWAGRSAVAYKRDFGLGGGPVDGLPRVIDLWWRFASALRIPYEHGLWSGPVRIARPPAAGAGNVLDQVPAGAPATPASACSSPVDASVPVVSGPRAVLLPGDRAAAPAGAPAVVRGMIAAGNQIAGRPYVYGAGHGLPLDRADPAYDCSSSVEHLLYGGGLLPVSYDDTSGGLERFGAPGPGRWVTLYASSAHVFMYVAGLRWDTWNAGGPQDGTTGIGWHPLVRSAAGFVARHPEGL
jgi:hypothetical protein